MSKRRRDYSSLNFAPRPQIKRRHRRGVLSIWYNTGKFGKRGGGSFPLLFKCSGIWTVQYRWPVWYENYANFCIWRIIWYSTIIISTFILPLLHILFQLRKWIYSILIQICLNECKETSIFQLRNGEYTKCWMFNGV